MAPTTIIQFDQPMMINSVYQSASVIEFERYTASSATITKTYVRIDAQPFAPHIICATDFTKYTSVHVDETGVVWGTTTEGREHQLTLVPYDTGEQENNVTLTVVNELWVGSRTRFYSDEIADFVDEATGRTIEVHEDNFYRALTIGDSLIMTSKLGYRDVSIECVGDGSYTLDGRTDAHGKTYSESQAFAHMCKWYGATVSHRIVRA